jgi:hypothetical protein
MPNSCQIDGCDKPHHSGGYKGPIVALKAAADFIEGLQDRLGATFGRDILKTIDAALAVHEGIARNRDDLVLKGLRASCADVCSYATANVPSSGCDGKCRRELSDWLGDDVRNMRAVIDALEVEHVETDIAMVELLKQARIERDQARKDVAHAHQKLIESNDARQLLADELVSFSKRYCHG